MEITSNNMRYHELIGIDARVVEATEMSLTGVEGMIFDETKNTLSIKSSGKRRIIPKRGSVLELIVGDNKIRLIGTELLGRPEDRVSKIR